TGTYAFTLPQKIPVGKVSSLKASTSTSAITLSWAKVSGATGYQVCKYDSAKKKYVKIATVSSNSYKVTKLNSGTTYKFSVRAYKRVSGTNYFGSFSYLTTATKPGTPTLKATPGSKKVTLSWNKQTGATGYMVYMATSQNGKYSRIATLKGNTKVSVTKTGLTTGKTYYFKVIAYKTVGDTNIYGSYSAVKAAKVK
ncbi:MAG: fibronectin type III domain-containing protein, partial [Acutalibacteraceae bacterium]